MAYELLGRLVWFGARLYVRQRLGHTPKKVTAGVLVAGAVGALIAALRRQSQS
jgi:hypothetical protein